MNRLNYKWYKYKYKNLNRGNVDGFTLKNTIKICKVVDVLDGQSVVIVMDMFNKTYKWHLRLDGYKTYTVSNIKKLDSQKKTDACKKAYQSHQYLNKLINMDEAKLFKVKIKGFDKYGYLLGNLYYCHNNMSLNKMMIQKGYAIKANDLYSYLNN